MSDGGEPKQDRQTSAKVTYFWHSNMPLLVYRIRDVILEYQLRTSSKD
jgi:hypothetical protein